MAKVRDAVFSILFWSFFATSCLTFFLVAVVLWIVTTPFDRARRINHMFSCAWAYLYAKVYPGWHVRVIGRHHIKSGTAYVLVANHTSVADIVLCFGLFRQFKWVSKTEVFKLPALGWNMRLCRYIPLVRGNTASITKMLDECRYWLRQGMSIMMFPEGTRSKDGKLRPFKHGAFTLAQEMGVDVVPIAIHGGHELIPKHGKTFSAKARILVEVLEPVSTKEFASAEDLTHAVRERLRIALEEKGPVAEGTGFLLTA